MKTFRLLFLVTLIFPCAVKSQDKKLIDSLKIIADKVPADTFAIEALREISWQYEGIDNSTYLNYTRQAFALSEQVGHLPAIASCLMDIGIAYDYICNTDSCIHYYNRALNIYEQINDSDGIAVVYLNLGVAYRSRGNFSEAINYYMKSLEISEKDKNIRRIADCKNAIGNIYRQKENFDIALRYLSEAMKIYEDLKDDDGIARNATNLGIVYSELKDHTKALEFYARSLKITEALKMYASTANCYSSMGCEYYDMDDLPNALVYHEKAFKLNQELKNSRGIAIDLTNIAAVNTKQKKYQEAINRLIKAEILAEEIKFSDLLKEIYMTLAENFDHLKNYKLAYEYHKKYSAVKDIIINEHENNFITEMNAKYETGKKDTEILLLNKDKEVQTADLKRKSIIIGAAFVGLFLVLVLAFYIYRGSQLKQKANEIISFQKQEVENQKETIERKQKEITDSIHYARRIQRALLASDNFLKKNLPEHFILYKPKDIVSGDFYWSAVTESGKVLVMAGDCTGHGVPGAFMSLLGVNFLNEIITENKITSPDLIFNQLRINIINALNPEGAETEARDGMDGVLLSFDFNSGLLQFALANNPLWIIRGHQLIEHLPDKMPIGKYFDDPKDFRLQSFGLQKGDTIYAFTDGYADQFGGDKGKKFKQQSLRKLLLEINHLTMAEQQMELDKNLEKWKGKLEQVDDILVVGIRI